MKILLINVDNPFCDCAGGQSRFTTDFLPYFRQFGEVDLLTVGPSGVADWLGPSKLISLSRTKQIRRRNLVTFIFRARNYVASHSSSYDLIVECFTAPLGPIGIPRLTKSLVIGVANYQFWNEASKKYHIPFNHWSRKFLRNYEFLILPDYEANSDITERKSELTTVLLPRLGFPMVRKMPKTIRTNEMMKSKRRLLYVGRFDVEQKGIDILVEIISLLDPSLYQVHILGFHGNNRGWLAYSKKLADFDNVKVLGYYSEEKLSMEYQSTDLLIMPSRYETFGLVQLEAAYFGVPTIAFSLPCFKSREDTMFLAQPYSVMSMLQLIDNAFADIQLYLLKRENCIRWAMSLEDDILELNNFMQVVVSRISQVS